MGMRVGTNITALRAQHALGGTKRSMDQAMARLSSGSRINKASDDAVGLAISENFKSQLRGLKQANRSAQDGISLIQISEGGLTQISNNLVRLRELAIQSASDTNSDRERNYLNTEYQQMLTDIDAIAASANFNGISLLAGEGESIDFQVNTKNSPEVDRVSYDSSSAHASASALGIDLCDVATKVAAQESLTNLDDAINRVNNLRTNLGAMQSRLTSTVETLMESEQNIATANSRIRDADIAEESSELAKQNVLMQSGAAILAQANQQGNQALSLLQKG